jgi:predicted MarR family transcription regulator
VEFGLIVGNIGELARLLRSMSGLYDQAARAATSL